MRPKPPIKPSIKAAANTGMKPVTHKLSVYIPVAIFKKLKIRAVTEERTISEILTEMTVKYLKS